jgi:hypothetical protein
MCAILTAVNLVLVVWISDYFSNMLFTDSELRSVALPGTVLLCLIGFVLGTIFGAIAIFYRRLGVFDELRPIGATHISWARLSFAGFRSLAAVFREGLRPDEIGAWYEMEIDKSFETTEITTHSRAQAGLTRSLKTAFVVWLNAALWSLPIQVIGCTLCLATLKTGRGGGLFIVMLGVFVAQTAVIPAYMGLRRGGLFYIQHFAIRAELSRHGLMPWQITHFLDCSVDASLLRKVGGSYIFLHELLAAHFRSLYQGNPIAGTALPMEGIDPGLKSHAPMKSAHAAMLVIPAEAGGERPTLFWTTGKGVVSSLVYWLTYIFRFTWDSRIPTSVRIYRSIFAGIALFFIAEIVLYIGPQIVSHVVAEINRSLPSKPLAQQPATAHIAFITAQYQLADEFPLFASELEGLDYNPAMVKEIPDGRYNVDLLVGTRSYHCTGNTITMKCGEIPTPPIAQPRH